MAVAHHHQPTIQPQIQPRRAVKASRAGLAGGGLAALVLASAQPALAQRVVPKISWMCPLGYVDLFNGKCSTLGLMSYTVRPTNGKPCPEGWMNVGGGYCRKK
jgi:hypothetical protein